MDSLIQDSCITTAIREMEKPKEADLVAVSGVGGIPSKFQVMPHR